MLTEQQYMWVVNCTVSVSICGQFNSSSDHSCMCFSVICKLLWFFSPHFCIYFCPWQVLFSYLLNQGWNLVINMVVLEKAMAPHLPGKSHGRRSLLGYSPWGRKELDTTEWLYFHFSLSCTGEGNGSPLQCSCLENPRDRSLVGWHLWGRTEWDTTDVT